MISSFWVVIASKSPTFPFAVPVNISINKSVTQILNGGTIKGNSPPDYITSYLIWLAPFVKINEYMNRINPPGY